MAYNLGHVVGPAGKGIQGISKTDTTGLVDTYTITYSDGTTSTFTVTNGESNADEVTEWESTPSDSKVPSEKLTKESLDDKADSNHTHTGMLTTSDVKDNLTSTDTNKPLSANQGKQLKSLVDGKLSGTKVTSWSSTVSDSNIPSEKLVKDSLDNKQATLVSGTNIKTINNNSLLGAGNINIQGGGADVGSFTELQALITNASSGDIIVLDKDYKNAGSESRITIDKPLTILGDGHVLDANNISSIFNITTNANGSTILDLIFVNGHSTAGAGGAIYCHKSNKFVNCIFNNNEPLNDTSGGAISCTSSNKFVNCIFNNNTAEEGGAISCSSSNIISNCSFTNNTATNGGAINCNSGNSISDCSFNDNTASQNGDNVYNGGTDSLIIYNCHVTTGLYNTVNYDDVNSSNLVTSWSSTVTDTHIASEKLIKDTIDGLSIPTKISDLANDSDFIETSSTSGLIKNDGTIDTNTYVDTDDIANNLTTTTAGKVLDARQGKALADLIGDAITYINQ